MAEKRFKYKSGWTEGVAVPDGLININGYDPGDDSRNYKLIEALNVDWKDIEIPWAKSITKWNSWNIDPKNLVPEGEDYNNLIDEAFELDDVKNRLSNRVDWLNQNYDYLKDNGYIDDSTGKLEIPGWSKNGKIEKSEDIIDAINYLIWRVIAIDYFTNNWNNRNSERVSFKFIEYDSTSIESSLSNLYNSPFPFTFSPTAGDRQNVILLTLNDKPIAFATTSPGKVTIESPVNPNIATINIGSTGDFNNSWGDINNNNTWYIYNFNTFIKGTAGEYRGPNDATNGRRGFVNGYKEGSLSEFDPRSYELSFDIKQVSGKADRPNGSQITYEEYSTSAKITITKALNELQTLAFNGNVYVLSSSFNDYGNVYTSTSKVAVPYFKENIEGVTNRYPISYTLKYGDDYDIFPYFFIKKGGRTVPGTNIYKDKGNTKLFDEYISDSYGSILAEDNQFVYVPPIEPTNNSSDSDITICCVFYYGDTDLSRQVTPVFASFDIMLTATVQNKIIFLPPGTSQSIQWSNGAFRLVGHTNNSLWTTGDGIISDVANNVPYAVRTLTYDEYSRLSGERIIARGEYFGEREISNNAILLFDTFVTTYCNSKYDVQFLGVVNQSSISDREIALDAENINSIASSYVKNSLTGDLNPYPIYSSILFGDPIYYSGDKATNYGLASSTINGITDIQDIQTDITTEQNVDGNLYIEKLSRNITQQAEEDNHIYNILRSTAIYPSDDGIIKDPNDNTKYVDADNDYYFLAFKLSSNEGTTTDGIAYSACKGYYFLRILRKTSSPGFAIIGDTQNEISYNLDGVEYTMRTQVKQTIYLNRLLTEKSQQELTEFTGKKYWSFYGYGDKKNTSSAWDSSTIAVKNESTNEQYMFIYNEGDSYNAKQYNIHDSKRNNRNFITKPERGIIVDLNGTYSEHVGQFGDTGSGAILYVNKFMRAINNVSGEPVEYQAIESDSVTIVLALALGNTERYIRLQSPQIFPFIIHKREYDIELLETIIQKQIASYPASNPLRVSIKQDGWQGNGTLDLQAMFITGTAGRSYTHRLFLGTNEFGRGSNAELNENTDVIPITMDNSQDVPRPVINVTNGEDYTIKPNIMLNINNNPKDLVEDSGTQYMNFGTVHNDNIEVRYHTFFNNSSVGTDFYGNILVFGFNETQSPNKVDLTICTDEYGVYAQKTLTFYAIASAGNSTAEPEIGG